RHAYAARVLDDVVTGMRPADLDAATRALPQIEQGGRALRRTSMDLRAEAFIRNRHVRARHERRHLAIRDLPVAVAVGRAVETGSHLVAEDARLEAFPLVALTARRAREKEADTLVVCEAARFLESFDRPPNAAWTTRIGEQIRVARVDDDVRL